MSPVNMYALLTTLAALVIAAAVLTGSMVYRARQRRTGRLGRLEDAIIKRQIDDLTAAETTAPGEATRMLRELRYLPEPGGRDSSPWHGALNFPESESGASRLGYRLFKWLLILAFFLLLGLMGYAWSTYPTTGDATSVLSSAATLDDRLGAIRELRRDWLQQVKGLGQTFVLTPVLPLLGAVIGYLFGVRRNGPADAPAPVKTAPVKTAPVETAPVETATPAGPTPAGPTPAVTAGTPASRWEERNVAQTARRPSAVNASPTLDPQAVLQAAGTPMDGATKPSRRTSGGDARRTRRRGPPRNDRAQEGMTGPCTP